MVNGPDFTRAFRNGIDVTFDSSRATGAPGRINLGGGTGGGQLETLFVGHVTLSGLRMKTIRFDGDQL